jgi:hypothetical protein
MFPPSKPEERTLIFRKSIRLKNGKVIYAWQFGLKAFPIRVRKKSD